jgi:DNA-binding LacI/PurR family transcriptional regulator
MSKQTAVEWLIEEMHKNIVFIPVPMQEKAKEMEKEQITEAFKEGNLYNGWALKHEPEQYYNETYKKEEK